MKGARNLIQTAVKSLQCFPVCQRSQELIADMGSIQIGIGIIDQEKIAINTAVSVHGVIRYGQDGGRGKYLAAEAALRAAAVSRRNTGSRQRGNLLRHMIGQGQHRSGRNHLVADGAVRPSRRAICSATRCNFGNRSRLMSHGRDGRGRSQYLAASAAFGTDRAPLRGTARRNTRNRDHAVTHGGLYALSTEKITADGTTKTFAVTRFSTGRGNGRYLHRRMRANG